MRIASISPLLVLILSASANAGTLNDAQASGLAPADAPATNKTPRTPIQQKINSQLLVEIARVRAQSARKTARKTMVTIDDQQRALVDIRSAATGAIDSVRGEIARRDGVVVSSSARYQSVTAWVPLLALEPLAESPAVQFIGVAAGAMVNSGAAKR